MSINRDEYGGWTGEGPDPMAPPPGFWNGPDGVQYMGDHTGPNAPMMANIAFNPETQKWSSMNGGMGPTYNPMTKTELASSYDSMDPQYKSVLDARGFNPESYFMTNGSAPYVGNKEDLNNILNWQTAIEQTPSFRGESDMGTFMTLVGLAALPFAPYMMAGLGAGAGAAPEIMGPAMESGFMTAGADVAAETAAMNSWAAEDPSLWNQVTSGLQTLSNNPAVQAAKTAKNIYSAGNTLNSLINPATPAQPKTVSGLQQYGASGRGRMPTWAGNKNFNEYTGS